MASSRRLHNNISLRYINKETRAKNKGTALEKLAVSDKEKYY